MKIAPSSSAARRQTRQKKLLQKQSQPAQTELALAQGKALEELQPVHRRAAGIDIGSTNNYVAIPTEGLKAGEEAVRVFGVFTVDHDALVEWLREHQITTVAMEATGIYWLALYDKLEAVGIEVYLVDAHAVKAVPGRKSDWLDCQWLQKLHTYGLLAKAFRPDAPIRRLRTLTRHRVELIEAGVVHQEHMQKALISMNLQLTLAVSDIIGETGLRIIRAMLEGERDPAQLVKMRDGRCHKTTIAEMKAALTGTYSEEHLFVLRQRLEGWEFYQKKIAQCDEQIEKVLAAIPKAAAAARPAPPKTLPMKEPVLKAKKRFDKGHNAPTRDFSEALRTICGTDLMKICGLNVLSVLMLIGEIGTDMSRWRSAAAFCSWLGLCPGTKISGGKVLSRRTRKVKNRASTILRLAAWAAGKTDTWIGRFYRRIKAKHGKPKAVTATARKLACVIYHLLKYREEFQWVEPKAYETDAREHHLKRLKKEAKRLGFDLVELQAVA